jgi:hypothetical protein
MILNPWALASVSIVVRRIRARKAPEDIRRSAIQKYGPTHPEEERGMRARFR